MRLWQRSMIALARNETIKSFMQRRTSMTSLARNFVGGLTIQQAIKTSIQLDNRSIKTSFFYLGEYVKDESKIEETIQEIINIPKALLETDLEIFISVDPTQIGYLVNHEVLNRNLNMISYTIKEIIKDRKGSKYTLMLDMEDHTLVDVTIQLYDKLVKKKYNPAITLQAYLKRTENDLISIIDNGGKVRLVKGAFVAGPDISFVHKDEIKRNFIKLSKLMLSYNAKEKGFYPIFATHDDKLIEEIISFAEKRRWNKDEYEFEMLYGVRKNYQEDLAERGYRIRAYLPFGEDWWPYAIRRVGENPGNISLLFKALLLK